MTAFEASRAASVPGEVGAWLRWEGHDTVITTEPLIYVRLTTEPDVFTNVPLRFLDERVTWSVPGDKCPAVIVEHYWKGTDICVKRAAHVCAAVLAEVTTQQGVMNGPVVPVTDPTKPYTLTSDAV
jgi:hypothetical protein